MVSWWKDLSKGASNYRGSFLYNCTANKVIVVISDVWYAGASTVLTTNYITQVRVPSAYLNNFKSTTKRPWVDISDSKFVGY